MSFSRTLAAVLSLGAALSAQANLNVLAVDLLTDAATSDPVVNFLVSFDDPATGVDATDFSVASALPSATVTGFGNLALDMRFGGSRPTRAFAENFAGPMGVGVTVEFWMATDDAGGTMFDYATATDLDQIRIRHNGGAVEFMIHGVVLCSTPVVVNDQQWHHVAGTWNSNTGDANLYVDGVLQATGNGQAGVPLSSGGVVTLGSNVTAVSPSPSFNGNLYARYDDLRIWSAVRSAAAVLNSMARPQRPSAANLRLNWQCDLAENLGVGAAGANDLRDTTFNGNNAQCGAQTTPQFIAGPIMDGLRHRVTTTLTGVAALCSGGIGLNVLHNGSITRLSDGAALAGPYSSGALCAYTQTPVDRPGTGDDYALGVTIGGVAKRCVTAGELTTFSLTSPFGGMNYSIPYLVLQFYAPGAHPGSSFPGVQVNFGAAIPPQFLLDGTTALGGFGTLLLPPSGITLAAAFPPGLAGLAFTVQGAAVGPNALNTIYGTTLAGEYYVY
jgi:hypothetical protein